MSVQASTGETKNGGGDPYPYPPCWEDDTRVHALLAPFRNRDVNPEHYDAKMKFWLDTIREYCLIKGKVNFCKQELQIIFAKGQHMPCCFDTVLEEMTRKKVIRWRKDYEYDPENSWYGWVVNSFFKKPLSWGVGKIKNKLGAQNQTELGLMQFIHLEIMTKYCSELQEMFLQPPYSGTVHHYDSLQKDLCAVLNILEESLRLCLHSLGAKRKIGLEYKSTGDELLIHLVKIPSTEDNNVVITEADHAVHNLQVTKANLEKQLAEIEIEIKDNENKARQCIRENKRIVAKAYLRKKHLLEKNHERRSLALHNIDTLLSNVHEAKLNGLILDAYKFGSKALQNVLEVSNLKYDNVDEIVSDVRESMDSYREVQDNLANANFNETSGLVDDEDELERELKEIMGESNTNTPSKIFTENNNTSARKTLKIDITDAELLDMLNGLEIEQNSPKRDANILAS